MRILKNFVLHSVNFFVVVLVVAVVVIVFVIPGFFVPILRSKDLR